MLFRRNLHLLGESSVDTSPLPLQSDSAVEKMICDPGFAYMKPWFYSHPYALRCELGVGDSDREYMNNAYKRALEIFDIIFRGKPDAMMFDYRIEDHSCYDRIYAGNVVKYEKDKLKFLLKHYKLYPHRVVQNIPIDEDDEDIVRKNRIVCYPAGKGFDYKRRIKEQVLGNGYMVSYVSFENECIFSVYDDRGCDIVFSTKAKMAEFFEKLKPYLLEYDMETMLQRIAE